MLLRNPILTKPGWSYEPGGDCMQDNFIELPGNILITKSSIVAISYYDAMINYTIDIFANFKFDLKNCP